MEQVPLELGFEPCNQRYGAFLVLDVLDTNNARLGHFWAVSRTYRGARGQERDLVHGAIEAHLECRNLLPSFGRYDWVLGPFWAKKGFFGAQNAQFWEGTSRLGAPAPGRHR